jgi:hypothetical protein
MSGWDWLHAGLEVATYTQARQARQNVESLQAAMQTAAAIAEREAAHKALIEAMRNFIFDIHRDIQRAEENITEFPQQVFIVAGSLDWRLKDSGLSPEVFPEFADKDYVHNTQKKVNVVISESRSKLKDDQIEQSETAVKYLTELPMLNEAIKAKSSLEHIQATENEWNEIKGGNSGAGIKKSLGILGLIGTPCLCLGLSSTSASNSSGLAILLLLIFIGSLVLLITSSVKTPRFSELKTQRENWRKNLLPVDTWKQVLNKFGGDLPSKEFQKLLDDRISYLNPILGNEFQKFLTEG